jgi:chaperonin cofactor prefoldin
MARSRKTQDKDVIGRLADKGEEALNKLGDLPGGKSLLKAVGDIRTRLDDTTTKLRKLDPLERRVSSIEKRLSALEKPKPKSTTTRKPAARKTTTRKSTRSSSTSNPT